MLLSLVLENRTSQEEGLPPLSRNQEMLLLKGAQPYPGTKRMSSLELTRAQA
jgi:hypothetical protein